MASQLILKPSWKIGFSGNVASDVWFSGWDEPIWTHFLKQNSESPNLLADTNHPYLMLIFKEIIHILLFCLLKACFKVFSHLSLQWWELRNWVILEFLLKVEETLDHFILQEEVVSHSLWTKNCFKLFFFEKKYAFFQC